MKREMAIEVNLVPQRDYNSKDAYGSCEWTIKNLDNEQINAFLDDLNKLVIKHKGYYMGMD